MDSVEHDRSLHLIRHTLQLGTKPILQYLMDDPPSHPVLHHQPARISEEQKRVYTDLGGNHALEFSQGEGRLGYSSICSRELGDCS